MEGIHGRSNARKVKTFVRNVRACPILERGSRNDLNLDCGISSSAGSAIVGLAEDGTNGLTDDFSLKILVLHGAQHLNKER